MYAARYDLGGRRSLRILARLAVAAGLGLNWGWLAAAGITPILIGVLPCVAMRALGLSMDRGSGKPCSTVARTSHPVGTRNDVVPNAQAAAFDVAMDIRRAV